MTMFGIAEATAVLEHLGADVLRGVVAPLDDRDRGPKLRETGHPRE